MNGAQKKFRSDRFDKEGKSLTLIHVEQNLSRPPTLILYFTARCRFYQNNTRARSDQNASEQIASAVSLLASWLDIGWTKSGQNVDPEVQLGSV